ncbi:LytTR family DNA-binding domain-containing protein [Aquimarina sp. RZ0]|uniref:LytR/AlgR family response regulator transcription factor n=1 Tax=Aquimarina sp. RZ0 TaxID=2607730 RepID=UPI0011F3B8E0|nr:LytTR family DNA-binding domain-containing protein [Aquimarina sp. RZ0]KAA1245021.1 response regulator transcription factor [Aquimarina sp. RZ0]
MIKKINAMIVDDELNGVENLKSLIEAFYPQIEIMATAESFEQAEQQLRLHKIDIAFLDIQIGTRSIFEFLEKIRKIDFEIIFISAHDHALEAFKFMAIDYLLKPIDIDYFKQAINRLLSNLEYKYFANNAKELIGQLKLEKDKFNKISIPTLDGYGMLSIDSILYCLADGSYTNLSIKGNRTILASKNLKYYEALLEDFGFLRIHNSSLISREHIARISKSDGGYVVMDDGKKLSISKARKAGIFEVFKIK